MLDRPAITNDVMGHLKLPPLHPGIFLLGKHGPAAEQTQVGTWGLTHFCICGIRTKQVHNGQLFSEDYSVENSQRKSFYYYIIKYYYYYYNYLDMCGEVRGQLAGVGSLLPCGSGD